MAQMPTPNTSKFTLKLTETLEKQLEKRSISGQKLLLSTIDLNGIVIPCSFFFLYFLINNSYGATYPRQALV